jgi:phosphatidylserine decarboxylase
MTLPTTPQKPTSVQPGGGTCMAIELAWARFRKSLLRKFSPAYVQAMQAKRQGECPNCPHDIIDSRDLKYTRNVCGYFFKHEDDPYAYRNRLGLARHGFAEMFLFSLAFIALTIAFMVLFTALETPWAFYGTFVPLLLVELAIIAFFRDPRREIPADADALVSPADGTITNIHEVDEPELGKVLRISIFLSVFNVHVNRCPFAGEVVDVRYFPGEFLDARDKESAVRNEQLWIDMTFPSPEGEGQKGKPIRVKQISGAIARRIVCWVKPGDKLAKGERIGMIKLGSRTDVLIPAGAAKQICVKIGDIVAGGSTVLLKLQP